MRVAAHYGAPDYFFTEFFRVHAQSRPEKHILRSITENKTGRPVLRPAYREEVSHMVRTVKELLQYPVAGIDLNMGCPAPKIYRRTSAAASCVNPAKIDELIGAMRDAVPGLFTVKMRIGFRLNRQLRAHSRPDQQARRRSAQRARPLREGRLPQ